jgi:hypothetical protein
MGWRLSYKQPWRGGPDSSCGRCAVRQVASTPLRCTASDMPQTIGDVEFYLGYTHLRFPPDGSHDHEWGAGVAWSGLPMEVEYTADVYASFEAEGSFAELAAQREFWVTDCWLLQLSVSWGVNEGSLPDELEIQNFSCHCAYGPCDSKLGPGESNGVSRRSHLIGRLELGINCECSC